MQKHCCYPGKAIAGDLILTLLKKYFERRMVFSGKNLHVQKDIKVESNSNWPEIAFDANSGKLFITGRSILENATRFYDPLVEWVAEYCLHPHEKTELHLKLEYFNTSTSKYLLTIINQLEEIYQEGRNVQIYWYSADEDMEELGEDYNAMIDIPFKFLEYSD